MRKPDGTARAEWADGALYAYDLVAHTERLLVTTQELTYAALSLDRQTVAYVSGSTRAPISPAPP